MRAYGSTIVLVVLLMVASASAVAAQAGPSGNPHIGHVTTSFRDTPYQRGFLPTAVAEAEIAVLHASLALRDPGNLNAMKMHARHVLHAVDPSQIEQGPGTGYGVKRAADNVAAHIEMAAEFRGAPQAVQTHSVHVATSARNTVARVDGIVELVDQIQEAVTVQAARPLVERLNDLSKQLLTGLDANADGRVGWQEGEGGLEASQQHMEFMLAAMGQ